jgi:hypothetical protein
MVFTDMYADNQCGTDAYEARGGCGPPPKPLVSPGLGRIVASHHRSSASYRIH